MKADQIREAFLRFFEERGHAVVPSSPVAPEGDPTLLFTNAGMNQFKDVFLGLDQREYTRAVSSQKCIRAGGKHNDLEQVGRTARHQTFFEMLGNFSFGDYFKEEAIQYAWEFLTEVLGVPKDRLWVTIFREDDEAAEIWPRVTDIPKERVVRLGEKDNFWQMGDTGPCGPCTEIHYDRRAPEDRGSFCDELCMEVWNLVFMQYDRKASGELQPLPKPSVDTGMGLERLASLLQGVGSNYETDLLRPLTDQVAEIAGRPYDPGPEGVPHRVIADHIRALVFAFTDGALPSNEGRGYVLRRILRRAARYARKLDIGEAFLYRLVPTVVEIMGAGYPELKVREEHVALVVRDEEESFNRTLDRGLALFEEAAGSCEGDTFPGEVAWRLYDTFGFPADLTRILVEEREMAWDEAGYERGRAAQQERSRGAQKFKARDLSAHGEVAATRFLGYSRLNTEAQVVSFVEDQGELILDQTPFYAESGGQVGDVGTIVEAEGGRYAFEVTDTQKTGSVWLHLVKLTKGSAEDVSPGDRVTAQVDQDRRLSTIRNHTATHLFHWALHRVVGDHAQQAGSVVEPERLRFDFTHSKALTEDEIEQIERLVNEKITLNDQVQTYERSLAEAKAAGVTALFGEKYGTRVRVVDLAGYSRELCGGNHVTRTGDIGLFKVTQEQAVQAGVRRVVGLTGPAAVAWAQAAHRLLRGLTRSLSAPEDQLAERVEALQKQAREWKRKAKEAARAGAQTSGDAATEPTLDEEVGGVRFLVTRAELPIPKLRGLADAVKGRSDPAVGLFAGTGGGKLTLIAAVSKPAVSRGLNAVDILKAVNAACGGGSGGRADMAQAGGVAPGRLDEAVQVARGAVLQGATRS